ncbi:PKD domain-containing protein [Paraburkholderia megapolitana]|nr:hypothetical protein [Paraburkholderia megapolitana]QDQ85793.1 hypothetical protein FNZ07_32990 [Paraburkholderia megapolitana]
MLPRPTSATSGDSISLSAPGSSDPDGDALTYAWSYPASVTAEAHEEHLTARLPKVTADTSLVFTVKVSHGKATTTASQTVVVRASSTYPPYREGTKYNGGEIVSDAGTLYRCKPFPQSGCCGQAAWTYEPGRRTNWQDAWVVY